MQQSDRRRWEVVAMLWFAYVLYQADKQIYAVVLPLVRAEMGLSGYEAGLVNSAFTVVSAILAPLAGAFGDRWPKHRVLILAVAIWSVATMLTGFATSLALLLLIRAVLFAGAESFYPPVSHAYLAEQHTTTRALAISIHQTAQNAGPLVSGLLAGWLAEKFGWRIGFMAFGVPGLLLSVWMYLRMPASGISSKGSALLAGFAYCFKIDAVRRLGFAFAAVLFVLIGYSTWAPTLFGTQFGLSVAQAGFQTSFWSSIASMAGALIGGLTADRMVRRGYRRVSLQAAFLLAGAPFLWWLGSASNLMEAVWALSGVGLFRGMYEATIAVTLYDYVPPQYRSSAAAVVLLLANLLAAPSAAVLGWLGDQSHLTTSIRLLSILFVLAAGILFSARGLPLNRIDGE